MDLGEECLKYCINYALENCREDLEFLQEREINEDKQKPVNERQAMPLIERLNIVLNNKFERITYTEAIDILLSSSHYKKKKFKYEIEWGSDLQSEHERYLVEKHFQRPVIITAYPKKIKSSLRIQRRLNPSTCATMILMPMVARQWLRWIFLFQVLEKLLVDRKEKNVLQNVRSSTFPMNTYGGIWKHVNSGQLFTQVSVWVLSV